MLDVNATSPDGRPLHAAGGAEATARAADEPVGTWKLQGGRGGAAFVTGHVHPDVDVVFIFADELLVKAVNVEAVDSVDDTRAFSFHLGRKLVSALGARPRMVVTAKEGPLEGPRVLANGVFDAEAGEARLLDAMRRGRFVTKKGFLARMKALDPKWRRAVLEGYTELNEYFRARFGYTLFVAHGSLLGLWRDGGFIPHDDDFDLAYVSNATSPEEVREERYAIACRMEADGWAVKIGASGLIKPQTKGRKLLDIMPGWWMDDAFWCQAWTRLPLSRDQLEPLRPVEFLGFHVWVPRDPEAFLDEKYGPGWRTPDPAYQPKRPPGSEEVLARGRADARELERFG